MRYVELREEKYTWKKPLAGLALTCCVLWLELVLFPASSSFSSSSTECTIGGGYGDGYVVVMPFPPLPSPEVNPAITAPERLILMPTFRGGRPAEPVQTS